MNINNNTIANTDHAAEPQQATQAQHTEQHNDPLIHIVLIEAARAFNFVAGMVGSFFNAHQGSLNLSVVEPVTDQAVNNAHIDEEDEENHFYPQTPNPERFLNH